MCRYVTAQPTIPLDNVIHADIVLHYGLDCYVIKHAIYTGPTRYNT